MVSDFLTFLTFLTFAEKVLKLLYTYYIVYRNDESNVMKLKLYDFRDKN